MGGEDNIILNIVMVLVPMILSLSVHEAAHAAAAYWLGDDTAKQMGRLTLNPAAHIDPVGTLLLPVAIVIMQGAVPGIPFFGWAKPVPFNPIRFRKTVNMRTAAMIVAAAGPISNIVLAIVSVAFLSVAHHMGIDLPRSVFALLLQMLSINIALAVFNMIPVYPLDGQKVLAGVLSHEMALSFERFNARYGSMLLIGVVLFGGRLIGGPFTFVFSTLISVFGLAG